MLFYLNVFDRKVYFNSQSGDYSFYPLNETKADLCCDSFVEYHSQVYTLCFCITQRCNKSCYFCFNKEKRDVDLDTDFIFDYINYFVETHKQFEKIIIDLSGIGEPLLRFDSIIRIGTYCKSISEKLRREIYVQFVTNGILLNENKINLLRNSGVLFGLSIEPSIFQNDISSFQKILKKMGIVRKDKLLGCTTLIGNIHFDLCVAFKRLCNYFGTICFKIIRGDENLFTKDDALFWCIEYEKLTKFLLDEAFNGRYSYFIQLINGDDDYSRILRKVLLKRKVLSRCNAGVNRIALLSNTERFICAPAYYYPDLAIEMIEDKVIFNQKANSDCDNCVCKCYCGGMCAVQEKISKKVALYHCILIKKFVSLSMYFGLALREYNYDIYKKVFSLCFHVEERLTTNKPLIDYDNSNAEETFEYNKTVFYKKYDEFIS